MKRHPLSIAIAISLASSAWIASTPARADAISDLKSELEAQKLRLNELETRLLRATAAAEKANLDVKKVAEDSKGQGGGLPAGVSMFGIADAGIEYGDYGKGFKTRVQSGLGSASRIGFRGERKVGGETAAYFHLEAGVALDNGQTTNHSSNVSNPDSGAVSAAGQASSGVALFSRQSYVGLKGNWGDLRFGRDYVPLYNAVVSPSDPFTIGGATAYRLVSGSTAGRFDNAFQYTTPKFKGAEAKIMYSAGMENNTATEVGIASTGGACNTINGAADNSATCWGNGPQSEGKGVSASLTYAEGPLFVGAAYLDYLRAGGVTGTANENIQRKAYTLGATYNFGIAKVYGLYVRGKDTQSGVAVVNTPTTARGTTLDNAIYWLGVSVPFWDKHTFRAVYANLDERLARDRDSSQFGLGYEYAFDKQTDFYAYWARVTNQNGGGNTLLAGGHGQGFGRPGDMPVTIDFTPQAYMAGVRYRF